MKQEIAFLGSHTSMSLEEGDTVAIAGVRIKEWSGERSLQTAYLSVDDVNLTLTEDQSEALSEAQDGPKRKAIRVTPRTEMTIA
eukprot:5093172-Karenia_brevis.AAC.1